MTKTVILNGEEVEVEFSYYPACRGQRDRYGVPLEPDEPEDIEIEIVSIGGEDVTAMLKKEVFAEITDAITKELEEYNKDDFREAA